MASSSSSVDTSAIGMKEVAAAVEQINTACKDKLESESSVSLLHARQQNLFMHCRAQVLLHLWTLPRRRLEIAFFSLPHLYLFIDVAKVAETANGIASKETDERSRRSHC